MNLSNLVNIATPLLVVILGVLHTVFPRWSSKAFPPKQRAGMAAGVFTALYLGHQIWGAAGDRSYNQRIADLEARGLE